MKLRSKSEREIDWKKRKFRQAFATLEQCQRDYDCGLQLILYISDSATSALRTMISCVEWLRDNDPDFPPSSVGKIEEWKKLLES